MSSNDLVYRTAREWREADGGQLFGGFARILQPSPGGITYRAVEQARSNAGTQLVPVGERAVSKHAPRMPAKVALTDRKNSRWTLERIQALPRTSGQLTRLGDAIETAERANRKTGKLRTEYTVACQCSCGRVIRTQVHTWVSMSRPRSCRPCTYVRQRKSSAFTERGYQHARDFAAAAQEKGQAA